jgi:hypothetical protein
MTSNKPAAFYYLLESCEKNGNGGYDLVFMTSDDKNEGNSNGGTPGSDDLDEAFAPYAVEADYELCENTHVAWGPDREKLLAQVAWILENAGGAAMDGENNLRLDVTPSQPPLKQLYYTIYRIDGSDNCVDFCTSDASDGVDVIRDTPPGRVLREIFNRRLGSELSNRLEIGAAENSHCFYGDTLEEAKEVAARIAGALEAEGFRKINMRTEMKEEIKPIPPKAPKP